MHVANPNRRPQRELDAAAELLDELFKQPRTRRTSDEHDSRNLHQRERIREHITGRRCLLLDYAQYAWERREFAACVKNLARHPAPLQLADCQSQYESRCRLIACLADSRHPDEMVPALYAAISAVADATMESWSLNSPSSEFEQLVNDRMPARSQGDRPALEPSFMKCLPNDEFREVFRELAHKEKCLWTHPGLLLAGETLATIQGDRRTVDGKAETWVMLANVRDPRRPHGLLVRLTVERVCEGCGVLVPNAYSGGYLRFGEHFSDALHHAWYAVMRQHEGACDFDWRWSLDLCHAVQGTGYDAVVVEIDGPSATAAFACAMMALDRRSPSVRPEGEQLDPHVAITAALAKPQSTSTDLTAVGDIDVKTLLGSFARRRIYEVLHAANQDESDLPTTDPDQLRFHPVKTIEDAFDRLRRWPNITRQVNASVFWAATKLRHDYCGEEVPDWRESGRRYVPSPLSELLQGRADNHGNPVERSLSPRELKRFAYGRWRSQADKRRGTAPRIRLFADSGLGKSIQMLICEQKIAAASDGRLPIRLGKTDPGCVNISAIDWTQDVETVLKNIYDRVVETHFPDKHKAEGFAWFKDLVRQGQCVILCDALDQAEGTLTGLGAFLNSAKLRRCPVVLAGRKETRHSRAPAFEGLQDGEWTTLKVLPFGEEQQRRFLGRELAPRLIPQHDELESWHGDEERRRHHWKDLLGIPILLKFLKQLALAEPTGARNLENLTNRYAIYAAAVDHLIAKGVSTLGNNQQLAKSRVKRLLPQVAWAAVSCHDFTGAVAGDAFDSVLESIETSYDELVQVDLVTEHAVLDDVGPSGLAFRHRSFLEFFAGQYLAKLFADPKSRHEAIGKLWEVHSVLDQYGNFRADLLHEDGLTCRDLPADWDWTLRFALAHVDGPVRDELAWPLICVGNPWGVYRAIDEDKLSLSDPLKQVCRWLTHQVDGFDETFKGKTPPVERLVACLQSKTAEQIERDMKGSLSRSTRDADSLPALIALLQATIAGDAVDSAMTGVAAACRKVLDDYFGEVARLSSPVLQELEDQLVSVPAGEFDPRPFHNAKVLEAAGVTGPIRIPEGYKLSAFPVTNAQFEEWCPTHRRQRGRSSEQDDQPVVQVTWYAAQAMASWLSESRSDGRFDLPWEWEWEYCCRAGRTTDYWWGPQMRDDLCWYYETSKRQGTRSLREALAAYESAAEWHPSQNWLQAEGAWQEGLLDLSGNVLEWTRSRYQTVGSVRVLRGAARYNDAVLCRSANRDSYHPRHRDDFYGVRLCWCCCSSSSPEPSSP